LLLFFKKEVLSCALEIYFLHTPQKSFQPDIETMIDSQALLRICVELRAAGDLQGALAAAREASEASPEAPVPYYAEGEVLTALGDDAGAVQAYANALRRSPGWADAWINLGLARYRQGAIEAAKTAMRQALRVAPGHPAATANLAAFLRITGSAEAGEKMLEESLAGTQENLAARFNMAAALLQRERGAEALALLDAIEPPHAPAELRHWHMARALALLQLGRPAPARAALAAIESLGPVPPELAPLFLWRQVLLAQMERDVPRALRIAAEMAAAIEAMGPNAVPEHRIMAHYDLARFFASLGERDAAFKHWTAGHTQLRLFQPFSRLALSNVIDANIEIFNAARFAEGPRAKNRDPAPVFIVGMPRSGTTLCEHILAAHAQVHGAGERSALSATAWQLGGGDGPAALARIAALESDALDAEAEKFLGALRTLAPDKSRIVDKMPGNEMHLGLVGLMLPGARIIHCVRDPRDIGFSIWTYRFHGEHPYAHDLGDLGFTIAQRSRLMAHWRDVLPNPILTVALQDWVEDFDATLARVLAHLDLPPDPACARFYESDREVRTVSRAQVRQPIHARGLGRWRTYEKHLAPLIAELDAAGLLAEPA
jgi:tetratricopeptide (TPR) repeat protein